MRFNEVLRKIRKDNNLTQEEIAYELNVSRQAITKWETCKGMPDIENLKVISEKYNVSLDELLKGENVSFEINRNDTYKYEAIQEYEVEKVMGFDITVSAIKKLSIFSSNDNKVKFKIVSDNVENVSDIFNIENMEIGNKICFSFKKKKSYNEQFYKNNISLVVYLPEKYITFLDINGIFKTISLHILSLNKIEISGKCSDLEVDNCSGDIEINVNTSNISIVCNKLSNNLSFNSINHTAKLNIPINSEYKAINNGVGNKIEIYRNNKKVDDNILSKKNSIEINGIKSKLIINEV